jgi:hypothetical protein
MEPSTTPFELHACVRAGGKVILIQMRAPHHMYTPQSWTLVAAAACAWATVLACAELARQLQRLWCLDAIAIAMLADSRRKRRRSPVAAA